MIPEGSKYIEEEITFYWIDRNASVAEQIARDAKQSFFCRTLCVFLNEFLFQNYSEVHMKNILKEYKIDPSLHWESNTECYEFEILDGYFRLQGWLYLEEYFFISVEHIVSAAQLFMKMREEKADFTCKISYYQPLPSNRKDYHRYDPVTGSWLTPWKWD